MSHVGAPHECPCGHAWDTQATIADRIATAHRDAPMGRARIHYTIIKGTTPRSRVVAIVAIEGDRLTYTDDGIWQSTITRDAGTGWALIEAPAPEATHYTMGRDHCYAIEAGSGEPAPVNPIAPIYDEGYDDYYSEHWHRGYEDARTGI